MTTKDMKARIEELRELEAKARAVPGFSMARKAYWGELEASAKWLLDLAASALDDQEDTTHRRRLAYKINRESEETSKMSAEETAEVCIEWVEDVNAQAAKLARWDFGPNTLEWSWVNAAMTQGDEIEDLRAAVKTLREATEKRLAWGHNDTCQSQLESDTDWPCNCGHDVIRQALLDTAKYEETT